MKRRIVSILIATTMLLTACGTEKVSPEVSEEATVSSVAETESIVVADETELVIKDVAFSGIVVPDTDSEVFYEIFVGSFSDSNGDGCGDLRGIINRFDYLNDGDDASGKSLGIEGIWLSPIFSSPSYHKYDVVDYYKIDEKFGTMDDLKELVNLAHERGVKVILDLVINHTSSKNLNFISFCNAVREGNTDSEYYDYYVKKSTCENPNGKSFHKISNSDDSYEGNFSNEMPEPDYDNPKVREDAVEIARYYLEEIGVDGFRFDAAKYIYYGETSKNVEFWEWYMGKLREIKPDVYAVAEVWDSDSMTINYETALNCFDFTMSGSEGKIAATAKKGNVNGYTQYVANYLKDIKSQNPKATIIPFIANHDMDRAGGFLNAFNGFANMGANIMLLGPGSPFIYYGEEIGMKGSRGGDNTDANRRLAMLWGDDDKVRDPVGSTYSKDKQSNGTVADQLLDEYSLYNYYKKLIILRKANPEMYLGTYEPASFEGTSFGGFTSTYEGSTVGVFHNTTDSEVTIDLSSGCDHQFSKIVAQVGFFENNAALDGNTLTISGQTSVILR